MNIYNNFVYYLKKQLNNLVYLIGNLTCYFCGCEIENPIRLKINGICENCFNKIQFLIDSFERCPICSSFITDGKCHNFHHINIENVFSLIPLRPEIYDLYLKAKYRKNKQLMILFSKIFDYFFPGRIIEKYGNQVDVICFVPISFYKKIIRGYNPSLILSNILAHRLNKPIIKIFAEKGLKYYHLERNISQSSFSNRFIIKTNPDLKDKNILLVDDIYTTGKTASFLADLLISIRASKVYVCTLFNHR